MRSKALVPGVRRLLEVVGGLQEVTDELRL